MGKIRAVYISLITYLSYFSFALIFFMAIWICIDVIGRVAFNNPIPGTTELVKSLLPAIVFLSFAYTLRQERHVNVEIVTNRLPRLARKTLSCVSNFLGFSIFAVITYASWGPAYSGWLTKEYEGVQLEVPVYPIRFIIVLGAAIFSLQYFINMVANVTEMLKNQNKGESWTL